MGEKKKVNLITEKPAKALFVFALPMILGNLFQQLYNMADSIIVGQFVGEEQLAAVGASYSLTTVFIMISIGGGMGASILTAQFLGAKRYQEMKTSITTSLISFQVVSILLAVFGLIFHRNILSLLGTPENIMEDASVYLNIYFCGLPFLFMYNVLSAMYNALGDSKKPLYFLIFSSVLNVLLDLLTVTVLGAGVAGVAWATLIAQGTSSVLSFVLLIRKLRQYGGTHSSSKQAVFSPSLLLEMIKLAIPSMLQQSIVSIGMLLVQSVVNGFGSSVLAGYSAASRVESICVVPMIAVGNAMSTFTAQNLGAGKMERVQQGYRATYKIIFAIGIVICVILTCSHTWLIQCFLGEDGGKMAYETGTAYVSFIAFFFVLIGLKASTDGVLRGSGDVVFFTISNLVNLTIRVSASHIFAGIIGVQAVWMAIPLGWGANYIISYLFYRSGKWKRNNLMKEVTEG